MPDEPIPVDEDEDPELEERAQQAAADVLAEAGPAYRKRVRAMAARSTLPPPKRA